MRQSYACKMMKGIVFAEVVIAIPILGLAIALTAKGVLNYQHSRMAASGRQTAAWAVAAQLERIQAGAPIDSSPPADTISKEVQLQTTSKAGEGSWQGFQLVTVTGTVSLNEREKITERISGYVREAQP